MNLPLRRNLLSSFLDAIFFSFMVGLAESYFAAFVLHKGHSAVAAGLVGSLPLIAGAILQLSSPWFISRLNSYKKWVVFSAILQGSSLLVLGAVALTDSISILVIYGLVAIYWGMGMGTGPAWNAWMGHLVPPAVRTNFFSQRIMLAHIALLTGQISGGVALEWVKDPASTGQMFSAMFLIAGLCRLISTGFLSRQTDVPIKREVVERFSLISAIRLFHVSKWKRVFLFLVCLNSAIFLGAGFFTPYMLRQLHLSFVEYMVLITTAYIGRVISTRFNRQIIKTYAPTNILVFTTFGMACTPALWTLHNNYYYLLILQIFAGFVWGLFEMLTFIMLFNGLNLKEKTQLLTMYNLVQTIAIVGGALLGAMIFKYWGGDGHLDAYFAVFYLSTAARLGCLAFIPGIGWQKLMHFDWVDIRPLTVRTFGVLGRPLLYVKPRPKKEKEKEKVQP